MKLALLPLLLSFTIGFAQIVKKSNTLIDIKKISVGKIKFQSSSLTVPLGQTSYVGYKLLDRKPIFLIRDYSHGVVYVGKVITDKNGITEIQNFKPYFYKTSLKKTKQKISINDSLKIAILGDSLLEGAGSGTRWHSLLFDSASASLGYNVPNLSNITVDNLSVGRQTSHYGYLYTAKEKHGSPLLGYDLVILGFGANGGANRFGYYEALIKFLRENNVEVVLLTQNHRKNNNKFRVNDGDYDIYFAEKYGCDVIDTWSFVRGAERKGDDVFHDVIHMAQDGHIAYAESVRMIFNTIDLKKNRFAKTISSTYDVNSLKIPKNAKILLPKKHTGNLTSYPSKLLTNPAVQFFGLENDLSTVHLEKNQSASFYIHLRSLIDLGIVTKSSFKANIYLGDKLIKSIEGKKGAYRLGIKEIIGIKDYQDAKIESNELNIKVTEGYLDVICAIEAKI